MNNVSEYKNLFYALSSVRDLMRGRENPDLLVSKSIHEDGRLLGWEFVLSWDSLDDVLKVVISKYGISYDVTILERVPYYTKQF